MDKYKFCIAGNFINTTKNEIIKLIETKYPEFEYSDILTGNTKAILIGKDGEKSDLFEKIIECGEEKYSPMITLYPNGDFVLLNEMFENIDTKENFDNEDTFVSEDNMHTQTIPKLKSIRNDMVIRDGVRLGKSVLIKYVYDNEEIESEINEENKNNNIEKKMFSITGIFVNATRNEVIEMVEKAYSEFEYSDILTENTKVLLVGKYGEYSSKYKKALEYEISTILFTNDEFVLTDNIFK